MILRLELQPISASNSAFVVPDAEVDALGGGGRPKVVATVEGLTWRTSLARMGGRFLLGLRKDQFAALGAENGRCYDVELTLDTAPRLVEVPPDLAEALASTVAKKQAWDGLSYTRRKEAVRSLVEAKQEATRRRRLDKILAELD